jgi:thiosulfate/3-mercaptopyruvate sulfurtransferase
MTASPAPLPTPLVSAPQLLAARAAGWRPVLLDCSFDLADTAAGERAFAQGHVAGAVYAHEDRDLAGPKTGRNGRHPLPARADWAATLARLGVTPDRHVVVYDAQGSMYAARASISVTRPSERSSSSASSVRTRLAPSG